MLILREQDRLLLLTLCKKHLPPDTRLLAYGSRVNNTCHDGSDLDLVARKIDSSKINIQTLQNFIAAVRDSSIPILIEIHDWARLPESFHKEIEKNHIVLWDKTQRE